MFRSAQFSCSLRGGMMRSYNIRARWVRLFSTASIDAVTPVAPRKHRLVTTPIFYVNGAPHIGHLYSAVIADVITRYYRLSQPETVSYLSTGTDEHGIKVQTAAYNNRRDIHAFCQEFAEKYKNLFQIANIQYNQFIRTTDHNHIAAVQHLWKHLQSRGFIYLGRHRGWYCAADECFVPSSNVTQTQDDNGVVYNITTDTHHRLEYIDEPNYFFRLKNLIPQIKQWLIINPYIIQPNARYNEVMAMLNTPDAFNDLSISRLTSRLQWGVVVPNDPEHTIYVWIDALTNYLTVANYPTSEHGTPLWPADTHVIGKDILKFHVVYWPALLLAADLPLPKRIIAHSHWTVDGKKMSKSYGNIIDPHLIIHRYGIDGVRYALCRLSNLSDDCNWTEDEVIKGINTELADTLGNLLARTCGVLGTNIMPKWYTDAVTNDERLLIEQLNSLHENVCQQYDSVALSNVCDNIMTVVSCNKSLY